MSALRLLLDQMIDADVAVGLRELGHDVCCVAEIGMEGADDAKILDAAIKHNRILVTLDEHFGDWAVLPLDHHPGVIRIKAVPTTTDRIQSVLFPFLRTYPERDLSDILVIVGPGGARWIRTAATSRPEGQDK